MRDLSDVTKIKHECLYDNDNNTAFASTLLCIFASYKNNQNVQKICINWRCLLQ